ncbi:hypothetical protein Avbf_17669 [Armadillidium vulgare]|nr:hypothetical protein Avbf_17669 [Armadillidium vulgare]
MIGSETMDIKPEVEIKTELSDMLTVEMTTYDEPFDHEFSPEENECDIESPEALIRSSRELVKKKKKEAKKFECPQCTYATFRKQSLIDHLFTHSNEKPYKFDPDNGNELRKERNNQMNSNLHMKEGNTTQTNDPLHMNEGNTQRNVTLHMNEVNTQRNVTLHMNEENTQRNAIL